MKSWVHAGLAFISNKWKLQNVLSKRTLWIRSKFQIDLPLTGQRTTKQKWTFSNTRIKIGEQIKCHWYVSMRHSGTMILIYSTITNKEFKRTKAGRDANWTFVVIW